MMDNNENRFENTEESTIFSSPDTGETLNVRRKKSVLKRQRRTIIIFAIIAAVLISLYVAFSLYVNYVKGLYEANKENVKNNSFASWIIENIIRPEEEELIPLISGEVRGVGGNILIFEHCERDKIQSIDVYNEHGEYGFYYDAEYDSFFVKNHITAPYDKALFSDLVVGTGYTVVKERISEKCEDFSVYGLDNTDELPHYVLTTRSGVRHTVYIGDALPSGGGYYVRYKGRDAVYAVATDFSKTVLAPIENLITPMLTVPMAQNEYFTVENFVIAEGEDIKVIVTYLTDEEKEAAGLRNSYQMIYPTGYNVNTTNYSNVLGNFVSFTGISTLVCAPDEKEFEKYGLLEPAYSMSYEYEGVKQAVLFSKKNENGNYYAYSLTFDLICEVEGSTVSWLEWNMIKWVDSSIFMMNIDEVAEISVESDTATQVYDLEGERDALVVTERNTGFKPEVQNFRQFYKSLLCIYIEGYAADDIGKEAVDSLVKEDAALTLTIKTRRGQELVYRFYPYSTRRALYTIGGSGEFYVLRDAMTKVITDSEKVMAGIEVDAYANS